MRNCGDRRDFVAPDQKVGDPHPDIRRHELDVKQQQMTLAASRAPAIMRMLSRVSDQCSPGSSIAVVGCGPRPETLLDLGDLGFSGVGVEPLEEYVREAQEYVGERAAVLCGSAENLPLEDHSQSAVILESVLEHVDSVRDTLSEAHRVLQPGGLAYVKTTNRLMATNGEFKSRFYQWYPKLVKESFVFQHLYRDPRLARYTSRPAVHWFTFADLCERGREAGFAWFFSVLDLLAAGDPEVADIPFGKAALAACSWSPWIRSLALTQQPGSIVVMARR